MKIIPAIDIIEGGTVRLEKGDYDKKLTYEVSPVDAAREWENKGAELLHVVDLDGAREGRPVNLNVAEEIARSVNIPVELGGGFRKESDIKKALDSGIWRVIVGTKAIEEVDFARDIIENFKERVILSIDAGREGKLRVQGWKKAVDLDVAYVLKRIKSFGAKEVIYTDVTKDGTLAGPDAAKLRELMTDAGMNFTYAGGVKSVEHLKQLKELEDVGIIGAIVGRALYDGTIDLKEAISACKENNPVS